MQLSFDASTGNDSDLPDECVKITMTADQPDEFLIFAAACEAAMDGDLARLRECMTALFDREDGPFEPLTRAATTSQLGGTR